MCSCLCVSCLRPLEDDFSGVMSEPKRPPPESFVPTQGSVSSSSKEMPPIAPRDPPAVSETPLESAADLFVGRSEARSGEPQSRKRKEYEEIQMEELESIMSMDIDGFDDYQPCNQRQQEQLSVHSLTKQNQGTVEPLSKRQRTDQRENGTSQEKPDVNPKKESSFQQKQSERSEQHKVAIKTEPLQVTENLRNTYKSSETGTNKNTKLFEDEASFVEVKTVCSVGLSKMASAYFQRQV